MYFKYCPTLVINILTSSRAHCSCSNNISTTSWINLQEMLYCASDDVELCQFAAQFDTPTSSHHRENHAGHHTRRYAPNSTVKTHRFATDPSDVDVQESTKVNVDDSERTSYTLGEHQDRVLVVTSNEVTITSTSEPLKTIAFNTNRWAHFVAVMASADEEAKELNRNTRPIVYCLLYTSPSPRD